MTHIQTLNIDGKDYELSYFPVEVQNLVNTLARAEAEANDLQYALMKVNTFAQVLRNEALTQAKAYLTAPETAEGPAAPVKKTRAKKS